MKPNIHELSWKKPQTTNQNQTKALWDEETEAEKAFPFGNC